MATIIDLSSDDETQDNKNKETINAVSTATSATKTNTTKSPYQSCQMSYIETKRRKIDDFIDHVVLIWLGRVRLGFKNLEMPHNILKSKAKEAASILNTSDIFHEAEWLMRFQKRVKKMQNDGKKIPIGKSKVFRIKDIIKEERPKFFGNIATKETTPLDENVSVDLTENKETENIEQIQLSKMLEEQKKHLELIKEAQRQQIEKVKEAQKQLADNLKRQQEAEAKKLQTLKRVAKAVSATKPSDQEQVILRSVDVSEAISPSSLSLAPLPAQTSVPVPKSLTAQEVINIDDDDVLDDPIHSYKEALDCLSLVEDYFLSVRNLHAVTMISQIEHCLKNKS
ncbi:uncharacterized protein LOC129909171 [Episyrphus balteatus]|uniref:uncharacterized protein LOC129909171 n=1 Tax=Episyrphus balteatus TaxID=286459 RepID=UPI002485E181|nr:uncharacterized protein LOC129909171 [Episyrphus balteatus]